jgi:hypothetical protein
MNAKNKAATLALGRIISIYLRAATACIVGACASKHHSLVKTNASETVYLRRRISFDGVHRRSDLKPENVLLESLTSPRIRLIDFGSACFEGQVPCPTRSNTQLFAHLFLLVLHICCLFLVSNQTDRRCSRTFNRDSIARPKCCSAPVRLVSILHPK